MPMSMNRPSSAGRRSATLVSRALDRIGSIWFGVTMLVLIFLYSSIGSAVPPIRQGDMADWLGLEFLRFDKTEIEWFSWWPFRVLIGLFCTAIIVVTLRRIPLTLVNAGVWIVHTGILILAISCAVYFGSKVEGDTVIFQSLARVRVPGAPEASFVIRPQAALTVGEGNQQYSLRVTQINPDYTIRSGKAEGQRAQQIWIHVTANHTVTGAGPQEPINSFVRTMLVGYPEYTEDVISTTDGMRRAVKVTGEKLIDPDLDITLDRDPVQYFYHTHSPPARSTAAIYARFSPHEDWSELRLHGLPHYHERLTNREELWPSVEPLPPVRPLELAPENSNATESLRGIDLRVTDFLPYAQLEPRFVEGEDAGEELPLVRFTLESGGRTYSRELVARDPDLSVQPLTEELSAEFVWADTSADRAQLLQPSGPYADATKLLIVGGDDSPLLDILLILHGRGYQHHQAGVGETFAVVPDVSMTLNTVWRNARPEIRPAIIPRSLRGGLGDLGLNPSLIRVEVREGQRTQSLWLPFHQYPFPNAQRAQPGQFRYVPRSVRLADGRTLWLLYSRWRESLPARVALDRFVLMTHLGGDVPSDYISRVVFEEPAGWSSTVEVRSNQPARHGDLWYFQAMWDPGTEAYTVLGVGNRRGVQAMLAGALISIAGMIYAFYVKPAIIRRRKQAALAAAAGRGGGATGRAAADGAPLRPSVGSKREVEAPGVRR
jgi:hypothetical protein